MSDLGADPIEDEQAEAVAEIMEEEEEEVPAMDKETRDEYIGTKVAKLFNGIPYLGEITSTRNSNGFDLFKINYRDGDQEDMQLKEVQVANALYESLQIKMWDLMVQLVGLEEAQVEKLKAEGITSISKLELFGGGKGDAFAGLDLPLIKQQELHVVATFLLNDGILTNESKLEDLARINLELSRTVVPRAKIAPTAAAVAAKSSSVAAKPRGRGRPKKATTAKPKPKPTPKKAAAATSTGRPRGRPPKNSTGRPRGRPPKGTTPKKTLPAKAGEVKAKKARPPPKERAARTQKPKESYNGPVPADDKLEGVPDWPHDGWTKISTPRASDPSHTDNHWVSPGGHKFRSQIQVRKFIKALADNNNDEDAAMKVYKSVTL